jgi:hypothetical protein
MGANADGTGPEIAGAYADAEKTDDLPANGKED